LDVPPFFSQRRGEAQSRGEREIRNELSFQASGGSGKKKTSSESPESLASRIYRTLDGVPRSGKFEGEHPNVIEQALELALISKKKWPLFGRATNKIKVTSVYQRTCCGANLPDNPPKKSGHTS